MARRFSKHNIVGSEAGEPRPIAYMRTGWHGARAWLRGLTLLAVLSVTVAFIAAFVLILVQI